MIDSKVILIGDGAVGSAFAYYPPNKLDKYISYIPFIKNLQSNKVTP